MENEKFGSWVRSFLTPYKSSIRVQMMLTMFFTFYIIDAQVRSGTVDMSLILILLVGAFAPKLIENFTPNKTK